MLRTPEQAVTPPLTAPLTPPHPPPFTHPPLTPPHPLTPPLQEWLSSVEDVRAGFTKLALAGSTGERTVR